VLPTYWVTPKRRSENESNKSAATTVPNNASNAIIPIMFQMEGEGLGLVGSSDFTTQ
jgi:hypothetical protein